MSSGPSSHTAASPEQVRQQVREAFEQLRVMSREEISLEDFCQALLERLVPLTGAHGGIVWKFEPSVGFRKFHALGRRSSEVPEEHPQHRDALIEVAGRGQPLALPSVAIGIPDENGSSADVPGMLLLIVPVLDRRNRVWGLLELLQRDGISESSRDGYLKFLQQLATLFSRWHEQKDLRKLETNDDRWGARMALTREIHLARGVRETAYAIANETRRVLGADRVGVSVWNGQRGKIEAISSQDKFDNRANVVKMLEGITTSLIRTDEKIWMNGDTSQLSPTLAKQVNDYLEESHSRTLAVIPLKSTATEPLDELNPERRKSGQTSRPCGAIVIEYFDRDVMRDEKDDDLQLASEHAAIGLSRAVDEDAVFLMPLWRSLGRLRRFLLGDARRKTMAGLAAVALLTAFLCFWPLELQMRVDGVLRPVIRRNLFSETEGVIREVSHDHNESVKAGEVLLRMESPKLELGEKEIEGQITTLTEQIVSIKEQLNKRRGMKEDEIFELTGNAEQLQIQKEGLEKQAEIIRKQMESLIITSPIDGTIINWDAKRRLTNLPIVPNQPLIEIAQLDGPWHIELMIPQGRIGYIQEALEKNNFKPLTTELKLGTDPNNSIPGRLVSIAIRAEPTPEGQTVFRGIVELDRELIDKPQPGVGVTVRVDCGKRPAGRVWFYQVLDFIKTQVLF